jgi:Flp pilus assembly protein TadG
MKRLKKNERGAALLEAAITIPIILLISVGIFEFGRAYQTWQVLTNAAREGARLAVIQGTKDADIRARVNAYLKGGGLSSLQDTQILVSRSEPLTGTDTGSRIQINYPFSFIVLNPVVKLVSPGSTTGKNAITMTSSAIMRNEWK